MIERMKVSKKIEILLNCEKKQTFVKYFWHGLNTQLLCKIAVCTLSWHIMSNFLLVFLWSVKSYEKSKTVCFLRKNVAY